VRRFLLALAVLLAPVAARAHDTFLLAPAAPAAVGEPVALALTSGMAFPAPEYGPQPERVARASASSGTLIVRDRSPEELASRLVDARSGLQAAAVSLKPHTFTLTASELAHYLEEIGAAHDLAARARAEPEFRETYVKHAKTLLCIADCRPSAAALQPVGAALEWVAEPALERFVLLLAGRPLANQPTTVQFGGERRMLTTDANGMIHLPAEARGAVMLSAVRLVPPVLAGAPWTSDFATLTLVRPG
jgi:hypothetical protein